MKDSKEETMGDYKQYVRTDVNGIVIKGFTDAFEQPIAGDLLLTGQDGRHFQIQLTNERGQFIYKLVNGAMTARTQADLDSEWAARPIPPDPDVELANAINAAVTLDDLKKALIGTNGKIAKVSGKLK